jgi:deazaflavin-dependent oxidoreductase (nitroreductase family)
MRWAFAASGYLPIVIGKVSPRAKDRVARFFSPIHTAIYRLAGGRRAFEPGAPTLLLTVPGRKSGTPHTVPLFYLPDGDRCVLCASYGGDDRDPQWYRNLLTAGAATVRIGDRDRRMKAELVAPPERDPTLAPARGHLAELRDVSTPDRTPAPHRDPYAALSRASQRSGRSADISLLGVERAGQDT